MAKNLGSRFCRECGKLFPLSERDDQICGSCRQPPAPVPPPAPVQQQAVSVPAKRNREFFSPAGPPSVASPSATSAPPAKPRRDPRKRVPRPRRSDAGRNNGPVSGPRTLPMLRALAESPAGLTTPQLAVLASSATSWVNALGSTRQLMLKQQRQGRVFQAGTVPGDRTRGSVLWRLTEVGERHVREHCP